MLKKMIIPLAIFITLAGCAELKKFAEQYESPRQLTNQEVIDGLKQALTIGSDSAATRLSAVDGYYLDNLVRILLPPEAEIITENLSLIPGGEKLIEDVIMFINRAAEDAAGEVATIFASAITEISIQDGFAILKGEDDAATLFLRDQTYDKLFDLYRPKINISINKPIIGNISTNESWNSLTGQWNKLAGSAVGRIYGLETVDTELDRYLTEQALNGLFIKLAAEEKKIRSNPAARVTDLLRRVFGH